MWISAGLLRVFRKGLVDEFAPYDRRQRKLDALRD